MPRCLVSHDRLGLPHHRWLGHLMIVYDAYWCLHTALPSCPVLHSLLSPMGCRVSRRLPELVVDTVFRPNPTTLPQSQLDRLVRPTHQAKPKSKGSELAVYPPGVSSVVSPIGTKLRMGTWKSCLSIRQVPLLRSHVPHPQEC